IAARVRRRQGRFADDAPSWTAIVLSRRGWGTVTALSLLNWVADAGVLAVSLAAVGAHPRWSALVLAYALSQLAISMPVLPGSLGIAEGSLVVVLVCTGVRAPDALAATLVYRLASFWLQLPVGWLAWLWLRHPRPFGAAPRALRGSQPELSVAAA